MIPIRVQMLVRCTRHNRPLLVLAGEEGGDRRLGLWLPDNEAERLARTLGLTGHRCVAIFDLVDALLEKLDGRLCGAVLDATAKGVVAFLRLNGAGTESTIPCHPADAVALATRAGVPIYATPDTLHHVRRDGVEHFDGGVAGWLARVRPDDFEPPSHH